MGRRRSERVHARRWSLARRVLLTQWVALIVVTVIAVIGSYLQTRSTVFRNEGQNLVATATLAADDPRVAAGFASDDPTAALQPLSAGVMADTDVDFATFMEPTGRRLTYHRPGYVGTHYSGTLAPALRGEGFTETSSTATAGLSVRAVVPVRDGSGAVIGALTIGRTVGAVQLVAASGVPVALLVAAALALVLGALTLLQGRYLRRVTNGLGPEDMARHFAVADAALVSLDEGIVITDTAGRVVFHNRAADTLLHLRPGSDPSGVAPQELGLSGPLAELLASDRTVEDESHTLGGRVVVVRRQPLQTQPTGRSSERRRGSDAAGHVLTGHVLTVLDHTAVRSLAGELATTRSLTSALRAQNHDHANRLHTLLGLLEIGRVEEAHAMLRSSVAHHGPGAADDGVDSDVVLAALLRGKRAEAAERGVELSTDVRLGHGTGLPPGDVVAIFGNLLDNALDAAENAATASGRWVRVEVGTEGEDPQRWLVSTVTDGGPGFPQEDAERLFSAGFSTKPAGPAGRGHGLAIVSDVCGRLGGTVTAATDSGTVFTVEVPLPSSAAAAAGVDRDGTGRDVAGRADGTSSSLPDDAWARTAPASGEAGEQNG